MCFFCCFRFCFHIWGQLPSSRLTLHLPELSSSGHFLAALPVSLLPRSHGLGKASTANGWDQVTLIVPGVCGEQQCQMRVLPRPPLRRYRVAGSTGGWARAAGAAADPRMQARPCARQASGPRWFRTGPRTPCVLPRGSSHLSLLLPSQVARP